MCLVRAYSMLRWRHLRGLHGIHVGLGTCNQIVVSVYLLSSPMILHKTYVHRSTKRKRKLEASNDTSLGGLANPPVVIDWEYKTSRTESILHLIRGMLHNRGSIATEGSQAVCPTLIEYLQRVFIVHITIGDTAFDLSGIRTQYLWVSNHNRTKWAAYAATLREVTLDYTTPA